MGHCAVIGELGLLAALLFVKSASRRLIAEAADLDFR
jgi:hypothetical protein